MNQDHNDMPDAGREIFIVGDLQVDVGRQHVMRDDGTVIPLPNLSFQLLVALIRSAPNVLSHDALMEQVWPGLIVSPETVIKRANLLREALGDAAREPRYIAGVRGRGYRLLAEVAHAPRPVPAGAAPETAAPEAQSIVLDGASEAIVTGSPAQAGASKRNLRKWLWVSTVVMIVLAFPVTLLIIKGRGTHAPVVTEIQQPASSPTDMHASTVAVLPFENVSADTADAYLAKGLPEMILDRLSRVPGLSVIARNSSFALPTASIDSREIGRRLGAGYLISGSVQRKADRLRVTVQLADADAGTLIWSTNLDRALSDVFKIEDDIADQAASELSARVAGVEPSRVAVKRARTYAPPAPFRQLRSSSSPCSRTATRFSPRSAAHRARYATSPPDRDRFSLSRRCRYRRRRS
jgi:transcriptional activator of cad operon